MRNFQIGDSVVCIKENSRNYLKIGKIVDTRDSVVESDTCRWVVKWDNPKGIPLFVCSDDDIDFTVELKREIKLKELGL